MLCSLEYIFFRVPYLLRTLQKHDTSTELLIHIVDETVHRVETLANHHKLKYPWQKDPPKMLLLLLRASKDTKRLSR